MLYKGRIPRLHKSLFLFKKIKIRQMRGLITQKTCWWRRLSNWKTWSKKWRMQRTISTMYRLKIANLKRQSMHQCHQNPFIHCLSMSHLRKKSSYLKNKIKDLDRFKKRKPQAFKPKLMLNSLLKTLLSSRANYSKPRDILKKWNISTSSISKSSTNKRTI